MHALIIILATLILARDIANFDMRLRIDETRGRKAGEFTLTAGSFINVPASPMRRFLIMLHARALKACFYAFSAARTEKAVVVVLLYFASFCFAIT